MSVTFWMPQAPLVRVAPYPEEPDYFEEQPAAPFTEINMANANAFDLLYLLDQSTEEMCGEWAGEQLTVIQRKVMKLLNINPKKFVEEAYMEGNFYSCGRDMDYVTRRLTDMLVLLTVAKQHGFHVVYG